ncbi:unnamed protein product [Blepharisma stoltei]|uniref:Uncharacterized protein n=1 Tax=Blepharisma stoltei TaxID=1481888 RepID=A0AAU9KEA1_9CILI|nr:unnamed protein product [Blepharisma stoltei]
MDKVRKSILKENAQESKLENTQEFKLETASIFENLNASESLESLLMEIKKKLGLSESGVLEFKNAVNKIIKKSLSEKEKELLLLINENNQLKTDIKRLEELYNIKCGESIKVINEAELNSKIKYLDFENSSLIYKNKLLYTEKEKFKKQAEYFKADLEKLAKSSKENLEQLKEFQCRRMQLYDNAVKKYEKLLEAESGYGDVKVITVEENNDNSIKVCILMVFFILMSIFGIFILDSSNTSK